jgi:hypothetical protein
MGRLGSTTSARARQMCRVLARWERSGLTLRQFGEQRGIPLSTLTWWRQVFRRAGEPVNGAPGRAPAAKPVVFTEVSLIDGDWGHVWKVDCSVALAQRPAQTPPCDSAAGERLGADTLRGEDLDACKYFEVRPIVRVDARHTVTKHGGGELAVKHAAAGHWMALHGIHPGGDHVLAYRQQAQARHRKVLADRVEGLGGFPRGGHAPGVGDYREEFGEHLRCQAQGQDAALGTLEERAGGGVFARLRKSA